MKTFVQPVLHGVAIVSLVVFSSLFVSYLIPDPPKFAYGDLVEVTEGFYKGKIGYCVSTYDYEKYALADTFQNKPAVPPHLQLPGRVNVETKHLKHAEDLPSILPISPVPASGKIGLYTGASIWNGQSIDNTQIGEILAGMNLRWAKTNPGKWAIETPINVRGRLFRLHLEELKFDYDKPTCEDCTSK